MKGMLNKKTLTLVSLLLFLTLLVGCFPLINQSPIITSTPITLAEVNELYTYEIEATDPNGDPLTYSLEVKPSGMTIISATGLIKWTPTAKGDYPVVVKVSDGVLDISQSFTIIVSAVEPEPELELIGIKVVPKTMTLFAGKFEDIKSVTATYEIRGYEVSIALGECTFVSSDIEVATVSDVGLVTGVAEGVATITVTYEGETDTLEVTVNPVLITSIVVLPEAMTLSVKGSGTLTSVTVHYNDGSTAVVALGDCTYLSDDEAVATVLAGVVTAVAEGTATITVSYGGKSDTLVVTVSEFVLELVGIEVEPEVMTLCFPSEDLPELTFDTFVVTANYNDDTDKDVTSECVYGIDDISIAEVVTDTVTALKVGTTAISISYTEEGITKGTTLNVIVEGTITIGWYEDSIRFYPDGSVWANWDADELGPATLILTDGEYHFANVNDFYNTLLPDIEGSVTIDGEGQLTGDTTYTSLASLLPIKEHIGGEVEIIIGEITINNVVCDGTMVGTYTQWAYAHAEDEETLTTPPANYPGAVLAPDIGPDWWFIGYTEYITYGE